MPDGVDGTILVHTLLASGGGVAFQVWEHVSSQQPMRWKAVALNAVMSAVLGATGSTLVATRWPEAVLLIVFMSGFWLWPVLAWTKKHGGKVLLRKFGVAVDRVADISAPRPPMPPMPPVPPMPPGPPISNPYPDEGMPRDARPHVANRPVPLSMSDTGNLRSMIRALKAEGMLKSRDEVDS